MEVDLLFETMSFEKNLISQKQSLSNCKEQLDLKNGIFKIPEPQDEKVLIPSVMLIPLLAFDEKCYRLGYGHGYYDRTIQ